jgi:photosystem II stability/assembly factor-like uncharacterized protein
MRYIFKELIAGVLLTIGSVTNTSGQSTIQDHDTKIRIVAMGSTGENLFAGTKKNGVYRSVDSGKNWSSSNNGLPPEPEVRMLVAGNKNIIVLLTSGLLFYSSDNGDGWKPVTIPNNGSSVAALCAFGNKIFVGTSVGLYESADDGNSWSHTEAIAGERVDHVVANGERIVCCSNLGNHYQNALYTSVDGINWTMHRKTDIALDKLEVHGNNFITRQCMNQTLYWDGRYKCMNDRLQILTDNGKDWAQIAFPARAYVFGKNDLYAVRAVVTENRKEEVGFVREIFKSENRGKSWKKVDEDDSFVQSNYEMQELLTELDTWKTVEIAEVVARRKAQKVTQAEVAAAKEQARKKQAELDAKYDAANYQGSGYSYKNIPSNSNTPNYRALSQDRFNSMHNTKSYIDSRGGIHIR